MVAFVFPSIVDTLLGSVEDWVQNLLRSIKVGYLLLVKIACSLFTCTIITCGDVAVLLGWVDNGCALAGSSSVGCLSFSVIVTYNNACTPCSLLGQLSMLVVGLLVDMPESLLL